MARAQRSSSSRTVHYRVDGIRSVSCTGTIKTVARQHRGVKEARMSIASDVLTLTVTNAGETLPQVTGAIKHLGYKLTTITAAGSERAQSAPSYRRALWIFGALNIGYGIIEMVGGLLAGSHALQADALDFLGDGLITLLGLIAVRWGTTLRARSAFIQGLFLVLLGLIMLATTAYHFIEVHAPQPAVMIVFAIVALLVDVAAALVLWSHQERGGDWRAVSLFSLNNVIGSMDVIIAAVLVAWFESPWPDLIIAVILLSLFLHSALSIIADARADLKKVGEPSH